MNEQKYPFEVELETKKGHKFKLVIHKDPTLLELSSRDALNNRQPGSKLTQDERLTRKRMAS
jgi:hypothetical protein